jgi:hypothetical protein
MGALFGSDVIFVAEKPRRSTDVAVSGELRVNRN